MNGFTSLSSEQLEMSWLPLCCCGSHSLEKRDFEYSSRGIEAIRCRRHGSGSWKPAWQWVSREITSLCIWEAWGGGRGGRGEGERQNRKWGQTINFKACPSNYFFQQVSTPKSSINFPNSATNEEVSTQICEILGDIGEQASDKMVGLSLPLL